MLLYEANDTRVLARSAYGAHYNRYPIRTHFVTVGEDLQALVKRYVAPHYAPGDILLIGEKIVSLCQGRVLYKKDLAPGRLARVLAHMARPSAAGPGVHNPYKMQAAITLCGRARILLAVLLGALGKLVGVRGLFYCIAGREVSGLDGMYADYFAAYASMCIRICAQPQAVCDAIYEEQGISCMLADANDLSVRVLGASRDIAFSRAQLVQIVADNPLGNGAEQTPFVLVRRTD
nr:coenzyme F420-0:L-glutamate ligase [Maliibacterium massiliense]